MEVTKRYPDNSVAVAAHYDAILEEGNDPVLDPPVLQAYPVHKLHPHKSPLYRR